MLLIRAGQTGDVPLLRTFIREFAAYENLQATVTEASLLRDGFGDQPRFRVLIAEWDGQPAGYALFFDYYSTFESHAGFFVEDIYVREQYRGKLIGKALLARVAAIAREENCRALRWQVLGWNTGAIEFYRKLGAEFLDEWRAVSLQGDAFERLAATATESAP